MVCRGTAGTGNRVQSKDDLHEQIDGKLSNSRCFEDFSYHRSPSLHCDGVVGNGGDLMPQSVSNLNRCMIRLAF